MEIELYDKRMMRSWNELVEKSNNGTFLFNRNFMEYHEDRFKDHSLVATKNGEFVALLPGNINGDQWVSHAGLTYGGVVSKRRSPDFFFEVIKIAEKHLVENGIKMIRMTLPPSSHMRVPNNVLAFALANTDYQLSKFDLNQVIRVEDNIPKKRLAGLSETKAQNFEIKKVLECGRIVEYVNHNLKQKYNVEMVHSESELMRLKEYFPDNIQFYEMTREKVFVAGAVLFIDSTFVHSQYLTVNNNFREFRPLDFFSTFLVNASKESGRNFSFGRSTYNEPLMVNKGLFEFKESFGAVTEPLLTFSKLI